LIIKFNKKNRTPLKFIWFYKIKYQLSFGTLFDMFIRYKSFKIENKNFIWQIKNIKSNDMYWIKNFPYFSSSLYSFKSQETTAVEFSICSMTSHYVPCGSSML
jgi:hypothetical protein